MFRTRYSWFLIMNFIIFHARGIVTEVDSNQEKWYRLRELLSDQLDREISIFEVEQMLIQFGLNHVETLVKDLDISSESELTEEERVKHLNRMNELTEDSQLTQEDAIDIGRKINAGLGQRYKDYKQNKEKSEDSGD